MNALPTRPAPAAGVWRVHREPEQLPPSSEHPGRNRYDDPRPNADDRYRVRYLATGLRGCLLEALAWLRPDEQAAQRLQVVVGTDRDKEPDLGDAVADFLGTRRVAWCTFPGEVHFADIHAPSTLAVLDTDVNVEPLLAAPRGRVALGDGHRRPHLDQAAVLLASEFGMPTAAAHTARAAAPGTARRRSPAASGAAVEPPSRPTPPTPPTTPRR